MPNIERDQSVSGKEGEKHFERRDGWTEKGPLPKANPDKGKGPIELTLGKCSHEEAT